MHVIAGFLLYARSEIASQRMTAGLFVAFIIVLIKLYDPVRRMSGINNSFQQALGASSRISEILSLETEKNSSVGAVYDRAQFLQGFNESIRFEDVAFEYELGVPVLNGISFTVQRGEVVAIVGPSGVGKSTLVNLLPRFYDVTAGRISIDGKDIRNLSLDSLRKRIAIVTQDVILFNDTIRANIAYGDPAAGEDAVRAAAKAALVDQFVSDYDSKVG